MGAIIAIYFAGNWPQNLASASPSPSFKTAEFSAEPEYTAVGSSASQQGTQQRSSPAPVLKRSVNPGTQLQERTFTAEEQTNISVYDTVNRGVVNIDTKANRNHAWFMGPQTEEGSGSGWVLDNEGHIVTNHHVISGSDTVTVTLSATSDPFPARIIGSDPQNDIAILKIDAPQELLFPVKMGEIKRPISSISPFSRRMLLSVVPASIKTVFAS